MLIHLKGGQNPNPRKDLFKYGKEWITIEQVKEKADENGRVFSIAKIRRMLKQWDHTAKQVIHGHRED